MIIANPIYDIVFKYLLDDLDIAKGLLSVILDEEIISLSVQAQETTAEVGPRALNVLRFDFKAVIKTADGGHKKVLIELQKAKHLLDIMRFRRYLGENYGKSDEIVQPDGSLEKDSLPIVVIYFLGFKLEGIEVPVLKVARNYSNAATHEVLNLKTKFVEQLTHNGYFVQIPYLKSHLRTHLERVLLVFSQDFKTSDEHTLNFTAETSDPLTEQMVRKLSRALASEEVRKHMDLEDELEVVFERELRKKDLLLVEKDKELEQIKKEAAESRKEAEESRKEAEESRKEAAESRKEAVELRKLLKQFQQK